MHNPSIENDLSACGDKHDCEGPLHSHGLTASKSLSGVSDSKLLWAFAINQLLTVVEVVAGFLSGSVSLLSDAVHNFSDASSLLIAYVARRISRKPADDRYNFGYGRSELIGAMLNLTSLFFLACFLIYEGCSRLIHPQPIDGWVMGIASIIAIAIDVGTAALLWAMSKGSLNIRAAFTHNLVDAVGSLAVLIGAVAIVCFQWYWLDALLTFILSGYIVWQVYIMLPQAIRILMDAAPLDLDFQLLRFEILSISGVQGTNGIRVREIDEYNRSIEALIQINLSDASDMEAIKQKIKNLLAKSFHIDQATLEFEFKD